MPPVPLILAALALASAAAPSGYRVETAAGSDLFGDGGPAIKAQLSLAQGIALDRQGNIYLADTENHRIRKVAPDGRISTIAGTGRRGMGGDGGPATRARFDLPYGLALDGSGNLYIADLGNHRVRRVAPDGTVSTVAGTGVKGSRGDGGPAADAELMSPRNVALDGAGNLYISEFEGHRVRKVSRDGIVSTFAGTGISGFRGDGGAASTAQLAFPAGLAVDLDGGLFIADSGNQRIRKVMPGGAILTWLGGAWDAVAFATPVTVAVDARGNLYVTERGVAQVRRFTRDREAQVVAGTGAAGYDGDGRSAETSLLLAPADVAFDAAGGVISTLAGNGEPGFAEDGALAQEAQLNTPESILMDGSGNLMVSDTGNHRVRRLVPVLAPAPVETPPAVVANAASLLAGPVAPGMMVAISGTAIGPATPQTGTFDASGVLATRLGETQVLFDGVAAPLFGAGSDRVTAQAPYTIAGRGVSQVEVRVGGELRARAAVTVEAASPALFTVANGRGPAVAVNQDGSPNSESNPAARGSLVTLFATGEGLMDPPAAAGRAATPPYPRPLLPVYLTMGGIEAEILYAGQAPGFAGMMQINARIPSGFVPTGVLPLELHAGGVASQPGVTIAVR